MQELLSDGSAALAVQLTGDGNGSRSVAVVGDTIWMLCKGEKHIKVRNARTGEALSKVDILDEGTAVACVGSRVWVASTSGKLYIFGSDSTLLGVLQPSTIPEVSSMIVTQDMLFTTNGGKDLAKWDTSQFYVEKTYFGRTAGEVITDVAMANKERSAFVASSTASLRCWSVEGTLLAECNEGANAIAIVPSDDSDGAQVWAAQAGWITVFTLTSTTRTGTFQRQRTLPCSGVQQLLVLTPLHVCAVDSEGLVTIWDSNTMTADRTFKAAGAAGGQKCITAVGPRTTQVAVWSIGNDRALIWNDEFSARGEAAHKEETMRDLQSDEIYFLRRKLKYFDSVSTVYRQKTGLLFRSQSASPRQTPHHVAEFTQLDANFADAMDKWEEENKTQEPLPVSAAATAAGAQDFTEYWKAKFQETSAELQQAKRDYENIAQLMHEKASGAGDGVAEEGGVSHGLEIQRAHHVCQLIKEKSELKDRERQMSDDIARLRAKLRDFNSPLAVDNVDNYSSLQTDNRELRKEVSILKGRLESEEIRNAELQQAAKHNQILKQRVRKLRIDLDNSEIRLANTTTEMQDDLTCLLNTVDALRVDLDNAKVASDNAQIAQTNAEIETTRRQTELDGARSAIRELEAEVEQRTAGEERTTSAIRAELELMCASLDDRDRKIEELQGYHGDASTKMQTLIDEKASLQHVLALKDVDHAALRERTEHLEKVVNDRKSYARSIGELQGRMEMAVEELRTCFTPTQFADSLSQLEQRLATLFSVEAQLRQKDDVIALKDDQIRSLQEHAARVEGQVQAVSSVFMDLPKTVEEVEMLLIEVDEYRRRLGMDPETQEMVQIRFLELQSKRKAGEQVPVLFNFDKSSNKGGEGDDGKVMQQATTEELKKLKVMSEALTATARGLAKEDRTGLVGTPNPSKSA